MIQWMLAIWSLYVQRNLIEFAFVRILINKDTDLQKSKQLFVVHLWQPCHLASVCVLRNILEDAIWHFILRHGSLSWNKEAHFRTGQLFLQFSSVQSLSHVRLFAIPWTAACQACLSITNSQSPPKPMSMELVMPSSHLILCRPTHPTSPPAPNLSQHQGLFQWVGSSH